MRTLKSILLAGAMLLAIPAFFSSCQEDAPQIDYTMSVTVVNDFSKVVDAINNGTLKNEQAIAQLTAAIDKMNADQQTKLQAIKDVLNSVNATIDTKLVAIEAAMKAQTLSLEGKLALIEDAMKVQTLTLEKKCDAIVAAIKGLPDYTAKLQAIEKAINALPDYTSKLEAIEKALTSQTLELKDKLAAIEGVMKNLSIMLNDRLVALEKAINALPDYTSKLEAIEKAISALPDYTSKLEAIEKALTSQTLALAEKLAFIQGALEDQTIAVKEKMDILKGVINDQTKALDLRLGALETAMKNQTLELKDKLSLLNSTLANQTLTLANKLEAISSAVEAMPDYTSKLAAIETAIKALPNYEAQLKALNNLITDQNSKLDDQIAALEGIMNAIPDYSNKLDAIEKAIKAMPDYNAAINSIKDEIANLVKEVKGGNKSEADALAEIAKKLEELKAAGGSTTVVKDCVDLGLPSGLLWAKSNMGTTEPTEIGDYYAWGETSTKKKYYGTNYKYYTGSDLDIIKKYNEKDRKTVLELEDDAANANLGVGYRIPTQEDWQELLDNCKWEAVTVTLPIELDPAQRKGIARWKVTGPNGKSIVLPMTGGFRCDTWFDDSDEDTYYTTANLWPVEGLTDYDKYRRAVVLTWPLLAKKTSSESFKKLTFRSTRRYFGVVVRPVFDRYSNK